MYVCMQAIGMYVCKASALCGSHSGLLAAKPCTLAAL